MYAEFEPLFGKHLGSVKEAGWFNVSLCFIVVDDYSDVFVFFILQSWVCLV